MNPTKNPCYKCVPPKRKVGCHSTCKEYRKNKAKQISEKIAIKQAAAKELYDRTKARDSYYDSVAYKTRLSRRHR